MQTADQGQDEDCKLFNYIVLHGKFLSLRAHRNKADQSVSWANLSDIQANRSVSL